MALVNQVVISGYVATEPQVFGKDRNVGKIRLRWDKRKKVGEKWESEGNFFSVTVFGGENVERLLELKQRDKILVVGKLSQNQFEDKQGNKRDTTEIIADEFSFVPTENGNQKPKQEIHASQEAQDFFDAG